MDTCTSGGEQYSRAPENLQISDISSEQPQQCQQRGHRQRRRRSASLSKDDGEVNNDEDDDDDHRNVHQCIDICTTVVDDEDDVDGVIDDEDEDMTIDCLNPPRMVKKSTQQRNQCQQSAFLVNRRYVHALATASTIECQCCRTQQKLFHCQDCVRSGLITRRNGHPQGVSLLEQQQEYVNIHAGLQMLRRHYDCLVRKRRSSEDIRFEIKRHQEHVRVLQELIAHKRANIRTLNEQYQEITKANTEKRKTLPKYPIKVKELEDYVLDRLEKINKLKERHQSLLHILQKQTCASIQQVVQYIFPIQEIILRDEAQLAEVTQMNTNTDGSSKDNSSMESETIAALADAKNTSYIRGKWVLHGIGGISEMQYRIVAPSLPANGDYTAYLDWLKDNKDDAMKTAGSSEVSPSRVSAFRIVGALTYTTQLTQLLSYYLNIRLPFKVGYSDFCKKLNEEHFLRKVSRLNSNIMYLAYTQRVQLKFLDENHTLENILNILDTGQSELGRHGYLDVTNIPFKKSVDSLLIGIETATESESEDENSSRFDWESVPHLSATSCHDSNLNLNVTPTIITTTATTTASSQGQQPHQTQPSENLVISAANRISSILRWIK